MRGQILAVDADEGPGAEVGLPEVCSECADHAHVSGPRMHNTDPTPHPDALCFAARRRMRFLIQALEEESVQSLQRTRPIPDFSSGDVLEVRVTLTHGEEIFSTVAVLAGAGAHANPRKSAAAMRVSWNLHCKVRTWLDFANSPPSRARELQGAPDPG